MTRESNSVITNEIEEHITLKHPIRHSFAEPIKTWMFLTDMLVGDFVKFKFHKSEDSQRSQNLKCSKDKDTEIAHTRGIARVIRFAMSFSLLSSPNSLEKYNTDLNGLTYDYGTHSEGYDSYVNYTDVITDSIFDEFRNDNPLYISNVPIDLGELLEFTYTNSGSKFGKPSTKGVSSAKIPPKSAPQNSNRISKSSSRKRSKSHGGPLMDSLFSDEAINSYMKMDDLQSTDTADTASESDSGPQTKVVKTKPSFTHFPFVRSSRQRPKSSRNTPIRRELNYNGVDVPYVTEDAEFLVNKARNPEPEFFENYYQSKLVEPLYDEEHEVCDIKRTRYVRISMEPLKDLHPDVKYDKNDAFCSKSPYEPQYIRSFIDPESSLPFNETRAGLCPYCPSLKFYELRTSAYAQHLALQHGILTNNYVVPNPFSYGLYKIKKNVSPERKTVAKELVRYGVICPCCYQVVQVLHRRSNENTLGHYLRHFKVSHLKFSSDIYSYFDSFEC